MPSSRTPMDAREARRVLAYPFDASEILARKRALRRALLAGEGPWLDKRVAILGGYTTAEIRTVLELFLLAQGIRPTFYESEYARYYEDAMFPNPALEAFAPDVIYVCTSQRNVSATPDPSMGEAEVGALLDAEAARWEAMWDRLLGTYRCPVLQNNFERPLWRLLGNRDVADPRGRSSFLAGLNQRLYAHARAREGLHVVDVDFISADYGLSRWQNPTHWYLYKYALDVGAIPHLAHNVANVVKSLLGRNRKGVVLDLDNTLWGGVVGDVGPEGIDLGPEEAEGQAFLEFQTYLGSLREIGVLLAVDSKNDEANALAGLAAEGGALRAGDFSAIRANWEPKDLNLVAIAEELRILPESLVFVDDNPAERALVAAQLPGVAVPELDPPRDGVRVLDRAGYFEVTGLSAEDLGRAAMYAANAERARARAAFADYGDYLASLGMVARVEPVGAANARRVAQLTNKSNQFNLTTRRRTPEDVLALAARDDAITLAGSLRDRFGDNGIVSVVLATVEGDVADVDTWLMSCRVLKRDMELAMLDALVVACLKRGVATIVGHYLPTAKNAMVRDLFGELGFERTDLGEDGSSDWELSIAGGWEPRNTVIDVRQEERGEL